MWRVRLARAYDWLVSRRFVGEDLTGNKYYAEFQSSSLPEKRYAVYKDNNLAAQTTPVEWWSWLHGRRDNPPTLQELEESERARAILNEKVRALEIEDEKERLRMVVRENSEMSKESGAADKEILSLAVAMRRGEGNRNKVHRESEEEGPKGQGDTFEPGSWAPSSGGRRNR